MNMANKKHFDRRLKESLDEFKKMVSSQLKNADYKITLFGSRSTGCAEPDSDADLFIEIAVDDKRIRY